MLAVSLLCSLVQRPHEHGSHHGLCHLASPGSCTVVPWSGHASWAGGYQEAELARVPCETENRPANLLFNFYCPARVKALSGVRRIFKNECMRVSTCPGLLFMSHPKGHCNLGNTTCTYKYYQDRDQRELWMKGLKRPGSKLTTSVSGWGNSTCTT